MALGVCDDLEGGEAVKVGNEDPCDTAGIGPYCWLGIDIITLRQRQSLYFTTNMIWPTLPREVLPINETQGTIFASLYHHIRGQTVCLLGQYRRTGTAEILISVLKVLKIAWRVGVQQLCEIRA